MGESVVAFFISVLLYFPTYTGPAPQDGWLQCVFPFPTEMTCTMFLEREEEQFIALTLKKFQNMPVEIKDIDCLTYEEAVKRNRELGHSGGFVEPKPEQHPTKDPLFKGIPSA